MTQFKTLTAALLLVAIAGALVPVSAVPSGFLATMDENEKPLDPMEACVISTIEGELVHRVKNCTECSMHCLTMEACEDLMWGDWTEPLPQSHLVNTSCTDRVTGPLDEELCVLLAPDGEFILDASDKQCIECAEACAGREECGSFAWNYTMVEAGEIEEFMAGCPPKQEPPKPVVSVLLDDEEVAPAPAPEVNDLNEEEDK